MVTGLARALICLCGIMWLLSCTATPSDTVKGNLAIVPLPVSMDSLDGYFVLDKNTTCIIGEWTDFEFDPLEVFMVTLASKSGYTLSVLKGSGTSLQNKKGRIRIHRDDSYAPEQYSLHITGDGIDITASRANGVFYAVQTLRQIMRLDAVSPVAAEANRRWEIPAVSIEDQPVYGYRGMHLDVCRHFQPVDFVKKYIDLLAYYKMNRFHWHLTDDQGWRIEIKQYPKLQEVAAWRDGTLVGHYRETPDVYDGIRHGGYFTQDEVKEVVEYAALRGVTVIPEIEMPGHAMAALAAYPELACFPDSFEVQQTWGVFDDVFCPKEETFAFLQNVLDEIIPLFPSPYIHIGGDECPKTRWKVCPHCQALMKKQGLADEHELQSYFVQRIEKYLNAKGKRIIGWDEILEGGLAPNATVMSWRGTKGGIEAAKAGHDVIMTPGSHCYFDHPQADPKTEPIAMNGFTPMEKVYAFNPLPDVLTADEGKHILGAQANLWTEYIATQDHALYMAYPRALALAETLWTPAGRKSFPEFLQRFRRHTERLDGMGVKYARHYLTQDSLSLSEK